MHVLTKDAEPKAAGHGPAAAGLPHTAFSTAVDRIVRAVGEAASWLWLALVLVIVFQVGMRYIFGRGSILLEELQWHIYGVAYLLALGFCLQVDRHVRIDVLAERWSLRTRTIVEVIGILIFMLPFCTAVIVESVKLAHTAWLLNETSAAPGGLSHRWAIKAAIPAGFVILTLATLARLSRCTALLFGFPRTR